MYSEKAALQLFEGDEILNKKISILGFVSEEHMSEAYP